MISYVAVRKIGSRLRVVKCTRNGKRIGKAFTVFPKILRIKDYIYKVVDLGSNMHRGKKVWNAMGREIHFYTIKKEK